MKFLITRINLQLLLREITQLSWINFARISGELILVGVHIIWIYRSNVIVVETPAAAAIKRDESGQLYFHIHISQLSTKDNEVIENEGDTRG